MNSLAADIDVLGRELARLIAPGSSIERSRRAEIRTLLRRAFQAAQDGSNLDELQRLHNDLRAALEEPAKSPEAEEQEPGPAEPPDEPVPEGPATVSAEPETADEIQQDGQQTENEELDHDSPDLAERMLSRRRFGAIDHSIVQRNSSFETAGRTAADQMAGGIEKRVSKLLDQIGTSEDSDGEDEPPRLNTQEENKELIVSKIT